MPTARQLADRLLIWHSAFIEDVERNDQSADDCDRAAVAQLESAKRCVAEAAIWINRDIDNYLALMGCAARYALGARIYRARAREKRL